MSTAPVFFMRGFNSAGDETLRVGPLPLGPYHDRFKKAFKDIQVVPLLGMGRGRVEDMGERALKVILENQEFQRAEKIHLVGHSMGGFVARYLAHEPTIRKKVLSVLTIATPHRGTLAAEPDVKGDAFAQMVMRLAGAADEQARSAYVTARMEGAREFSEKFPDLPGIHYASIVGRRSFRKLPLMFQVLERRNNVARDPSDGLISVESQRWGHVLDEVSLDHLEQIGVCGHAAPWERIRFSLEFRRQCRLLRAYWRSFNP
jgi:pimeloyl-ACP methyl ester carboxylesterase